MSSFELPSPEIFTSGAIGPAGQRVFYLQARDDQLVLTLRCEKQQITALADYFDGLLDDLEPAPYDLVTGNLDLVEPVQELWTVGPIGVAYDEPTDRVVVVFEELTAEEPNADGPIVKVHLNRSQVAAFVGHARILVSAGRPPCRFCGLPVDAEGHACPRMN